MKLVKEHVNFQHVSITKAVTREMTEVYGSVDFYLKGPGL